MRSLAWKRRWIGEPFDGPHTVALIEQLVYGEEPAPSLAQSRSALTVAFAEELHEHPELLADYVRCFGPEADATLAVWGPGIPEQQLLAHTLAAVERAGLHPDALPDVVLIPHGNLPAVDRMLAERAGAVLSSWPPAGRLGELPRFSAAAQLPALAAA